MRISDFYYTLWPTTGFGVFRAFLLGKQSFSKIMRVKYDNTEL